MRPITIQPVAYASDDYRAICALREAVLRVPIGMVLRPEDVALDETEIHIAAFEGDTIIGCVLLRPLEHGAVKLRQMAVADSHQGRGIGADLVRAAHRIALAHGFTEMQTNARKTAQGFYEKLGYRVASEPFIEVNIHTLTMLRDLAADDA